MDPQVARLQANVDSLQKDVQRISVLTAPEPPERQPKDRHADGETSNQATPTSGRTAAASTRKQKS